MNPKTTKIAYWTITIIFAVAVAGTAIPTEAGEEVMAALGYPTYLLDILLVAKIFGALTVIQPKFKTIKEWAYAGFTIDFMGAATSGIIATGNAEFVIMPLIFLVVMFGSYYLWKKKESLTVA